MVDRRALGAGEHHQAEAVVGEGLGLSPRQTRLDDVRRNRGKSALHMSVDVRQSLVPSNNVCDRQGMYARPTEEIA